MKRILSLLLALAMVMSMCPAVFAAETDAEVNEPAEEYLTLVVGENPVTLNPNTNYYLRLDLGSVMEPAGTMTWAGDVAMTTANGEIVTSPYDLANYSPMTGLTATVAAETAANFVITLAEEKAEDGLVLGENAIEVTDSWGGATVKISTPGSYVLDAAEGETNADVYVGDDFNSEWVELPYAFTVADGETVQFKIFTLDYSADTIDLVLSEAVAEHTHALTKVETVRATCTVDGVKEHYICECGAIFEDAEGTVALTAEDITILAMGHDRPEKFEAKRATCDEAGNYEYYLCGVCGAYLFKDEENQSWTEVTREDVVILPIGHERAEKFEAKRATCTEAGNYEYYLCGGCGKYLVKDNENQKWVEVTREDVVILPLGHERPELIEAKRATCTEAGNIEYFLCGGCGAYLLKDDENQQWVEVTREDVVILPIGHERPELIEAKRATCTEAGNIQYWLCGGCGNYLIKDNENQQWVEVTREDVVILAMGHERPEKIDAVRATCTEAGNKEYYLCGACGKYLIKDNEKQEWVEVTREDIVILPLGHERPELIEAKRATCTEAGNIQYWLCGGCGKYLLKIEETQSWVEVSREDVVILPIGHERPELIEAKRATCDEAGNIEYYLCGGCGKYLLKIEETQSWVEVSREDVVILPTGHERPELIEAKRATCEEAGNIEYYLCGGCGKYLVKDNENQKWVEVTREDVVILPLGHERPELIEAKRATCDEAGNIQYWLCGGCGKYLLKDNENQKWVEVTREDVVILPIGHERPELIEAKRATCDEAGNIEYFLCGGCGKYLLKDNETQEWVEVTREDVVILPLGHERIEKIEAVEATEEVAGNIEYWYCSACSKYFAERAAINELTFPEDIVVAPHTHEPALVEAVRATCTVNGVSEHYACWCGVKFADAEGTERLTDEQVTILAMGHDRPELIEAKRATCTEAGNIEYYLCGGCGKYLLKDNENQKWVEVTREDVVILPLGHERPELIEAKRPTCDEPGNSEYFLCGVCGAYLLKDNENQKWVEVTREDIVILPIGHERLEKIDAKRASCDEPGNIEYYLCGICGKYLLKDNENQQWVEVTREDILILPMGHERPELIEAKRATCTEGGNIQYWLCGTCGKYLLKDEENQQWVEVTREDVVILPIGHERPEKFEAKRPTCDEAGNIEYYLCGGCGAYLIKDEENQMWVEVTREDVVILPMGHERPELIEAKRATCTEPGNIQYWLCGGCGKYLIKDNENQQWVEVTREDIIILPMGHEHPELISAQRATCTVAGNIQYWLCGGCGAYLLKDAETKEWIEVTREDIVILPIGHERPELIEAKRPTCTEPGNKEYYLCGGCGAYLLKDEENQEWVEVTREDIILLPIGHGRPEKIDAKRATCTEAGNIEYYLCGVCGAYLIKDNENQTWVEVTREDVVILPIGHERPDLIEAKRATCDEAGNIQYWLCGGCGAYLIKDEENQTWVEVTREDVVILPIGHERPELIEAKRATCTEAGNIQYWLCGGCGKYLLKDEENQAWVEVTREDVIILPIGHERPELIEAVAPTYSAMGNIQYWLCGGCGSYLIKDSETQAWVEVTREDVIIPALESPFVDVQNAGDYFYTPALWAVDNKIIAGVSATEFGANQNCSRAMVITMLWRQAGSPAPASTVNPFTDVENGVWYTDAILWAVEQGITSGKTANEFAPNSACTRAEVITFMWRNANKPDATAENIFTDVEDGVWYTNAILWAVGLGITDGVSATEFAPNTVCTRGQVVTFLYRQANAQ